jgi:hypothetical protein
VEDAAKWWCEVAAFMRTLIALRPARLTVSTFAAVVVAEETPGAAGAAAWPVAYEANVRPASVEDEPTNTILTGAANMFFFGFHLALWAAFAVMMSMVEVIAPLRMLGCVGTGAVHGAGTGAFIGLLRGGPSGILPGAGWGALGSNQCWTLQLRILI